MGDGEADVKIIKCVRCGSPDLSEQGGYAVCAYCRSRFSLEADDLPRKESAISVQSDIDALLAKCQSDPVNRFRYASLVLDLDPTNSAAAKYLQ